MYARVRDGFAALFVPIACWQLWLFPTVPNYYVQHALLYPCFCFWLYAWQSGHWHWREALQRWRWTFWLVVLVCLMQGYAQWTSAQYFVPEARLQAAAFTWFKLLAQIPFLAFFFEILCLLVATQRSRLYLLYGSICAFFALTVLCGVQALYIFTVQPTNNLSHWLQSWTSSFLLCCAPWVEARWPASVYNLYQKGTYTLTTLRCNGFFEEASALAAVIGVFFVPLAIGLWQTGKRFQHKALLYTGRTVLIACFFLLLASRCATGVGLALLLLLYCGALWLRGLTWQKQGAVLLLMALCAVLTSTAYTFKTGYSWNNFSKDKQGRLAVTSLSVEIAHDFPLFGVGRGWFSAHCLQRTPHASAYGEEFRQWHTQKTIPQLCALGAVLAEYGFIITALAFFAYILLIRKIAAQWQRKGGVYWHCLLYWSCSYGVFASITALGSLDIRSPLFCLPLFFFCAALHNPSSQKMI